MHLITGRPAGHRLHLGRRRRRGLCSLRGRGRAGRFLPHGSPFLVAFAPGAAADRRDEAALRRRRLGRRRPRPALRVAIQGQEVRHVGFLPWGGGEGSQGPQGVFFFFFFFFCSLLGGGRQEEEDRLRPPGLRGRLREPGVPPARPHAARHVRPGPARRPPRAAAGGERGDTRGAEAVPGRAGPRRLSLFL